MSTSQNHSDDYVKLEKNMMKFGLAIKGLNEKLDQYKEGVNGLNNQFDEYKESIQNYLETGKLALRIKNNEREVNEMIALREKFEDEIKRIDKINKKIQQIYEEFEIYINAINELKDRCDKTESDVAELQTNLESTQKDVADIKDRVETCEENITSNKNEIDELRILLEGLEKRHDEDINSLRDEMKELIEETRENTVKELKEGFKKSNKKLKDSFNEQLSQLRTDTENNLRDTAKKLEDKHRELSNDFIKLRRELSDQCQSCRVDVDVIKDQIATHETLIKDNAKTFNDELKKSNVIINRHTNLIEKNENSIQQLFEMSRKIKEVDLEGLQIQINENKAEYNQFVDKVEDKERSLEETIQSNNEKTSQALADTTDNFEKFKLQVTKNFSKNEQKHEEIMNKLSSNEQQIISQERQLNSLADDNIKFQESFEEKFNDFHDKSELKLNEIELKSESAKRSISLKSQMLEDELNKVKKDMNQVKNDTNKELTRFQQEFDIYQDQNKRDFAEFKRNTEKILIAKLDDEKEQLKKDINDWNEIQIKQLNIKIDNVNETLNTFSSSDGRNLGNLVDKINKLEIELSEKIDKSISEPRLKKELENSIAKLNEEISVQMNQISFNFEDYKNKNDASMVDSIGELRERVAELENSSANMNNSMDQNQKYIHDSTEKLLNMIKTVQTKNKDTDDSLNEFKTNLSDDMDAAKEEIKKINDTIIQNKDDYIKRNDKLNDLLKQSFEDVQSNMVATFQKEFLDIHGQLKDTNNKCTQSKLQEEKLLKYIKETDSYSKTQTNLLDKKMDNAVEQLNKGLQNKVIELLSKIDKVQMLYDMLKGDSDTNFPSIVRSISSIKKQLEAKFGSCDQSIKKVYDSLSVKLNNYNASNISEALSIKKSIEDLKTEEAKNLSKVELNLNDKFTATSVALQKNLLNLTKQFNEFVGADDIKVADIIALIRKTRTDLENADDIIIKSVEDHDNYLQEQINQVSSQLLNYSQEVEKMFKKTRDKTEEKIKKLHEELEKCVNKIKELFTQINNEVERISDNGKLTLPSVRSELKLFVTSTVDSFAKTLDNLKIYHDSFMDQIKAVKQEIEDLRNGANEISLSSLSSRIDKDEQEINQVRNDHLEFVENSNASLHKSEEKSLTKISELESIISNFEKKLEISIEDIKTTSTTAEERIQKKFNEMSQEFGNVKTEVEAKNKKIMKEIMENLDYFNDTNAKTSEDISARQSNIELALEGNEKKFHEKLAAIDEKLIEKISNFETLTSKNIDEKSDEMKEKIKVIEDKLRENANSANELFNSSLEFYKDETNKLKIEITKLRGETSSKGKESLGNESLATLSQLIRKMRDSNETRFKSIEEKNLLLNEALNQNNSEINNKLLNGDKNIQTQVDDLKIKFQNLETNVGSCKDDTIKDINENYSRLEHMINKNEDTFNSTIGILQTRLDTTIQANEANNKAQFDTINSSLTEITNTINSNSTAAKKLVEEATKNIDDYFKKDNESIRSTVADLSEKMSKRTMKIIDTCNKKFSEFDEKTESLSNVKDNTLAEIKLIVENSESKLSEIISSTDKKLNIFNQNFSHQIELLSQRSDDIQKVMNSNAEIEKRDILKLQTDINNIQTTTTAALDQMMSAIKSHLDKRKQEIKKLNNKVQLDVQQINEQLEIINGQLSKNSQSYKDSLGSLIADIRKESQAELFDQKEATSEISIKLKEISQDVLLRINPAFNDINEKIAAAGTRIDGLESSIRNNQVKTNQDFTEIDEQFNKVNNLIQSTQSILTDRIENEKKELADRNSKTLLQVENLGLDHNQTQTKLETIFAEIDELKKVHLYNADIESLTIKFEEVLVYLEKNKEEICNFIHSTFLGSSLLPIKGDPLYTDASRDMNVVKDHLSEIQQAINIEKKINGENGDSVKIIDNLKDDVEIGRLIRSELRTHVSVKVKIPKSTRVTWNKTVQISPHQKVIIEGEDRSSSIIQMTGMETFGGVSVNLDGDKIEDDNKYVVVCDASRCLIDGFSSLTIRNIRIEANCTVDENEQLDLRALFVCRGWDAVGPSLVCLSGCLVNSDHSVVNVAGNAFAHIQFDQCKLTNSGIDNNFNDNKDKTVNDANVIFPVTAESGAYPNGYAVIASNQTVLAGKGIEWMKSLYLLDSDSNIE